MDNKTDFITINGRRIGPGHPTYVAAEISCNHRGSFEKAVQIIRAAKKSGADAVKLQTYTPDTITLDSEKPFFKIQDGNTWAGRTLHQLYQEAFTPWEWQPKLQRIAREEGLDLFSSPFDQSAVEFLEKLDMPAYKIASFEIVDIPLIERAARTGKPLLISTGLATLEEIQGAVEAARRAGASEILVLKCTSGYPAPAETMNLSAIPFLSKTLNVPVGFSDHSLGVETAQAAVALGACLVEKHLILNRSDGGPDAGFSAEPEEFRRMVEGIRTVEKSIGSPRYALSAEEEKNRCFRRSLFVVEDIRAGEIFTPKNLRSIRPAHGLSPKHLNEVLGKKAARNIERGTPLTWDLVEQKQGAQEACRAKS